MAQSTVRTATAVLPLLLMMLITGPASALPPATGSKCDSSWVNNAGAMNCFIQGEDESHAGVANPHYVACVGGDIFCCVNDSKGNQNCVAQAAVQRTTPAQWIKGILAAQQTMMKSIPPAKNRIDGSVSKSQGSTNKTSE
jgi:hypothetical protein